MGVMACNRKDCKNIMCDKYSHELGYICNECFSEIEELLYSGCKVHVEDFMNTPKKSKYTFVSNTTELDKVFGNAWELR